MIAPIRAIMEQIPIPVLRRFVGKSSLAYMYIIAYDADAKNFSEPFIVFMTIVLAKNMKYIILPNIIQKKATTNQCFYLP